MYLYLAGLTGLALPATGGAQEARPAEVRRLTLVEARSEARRNAFEVRAARARAEGAREAARGAGAFLLPSVTVDGGAVRSDDPVAAFGGRLRQGRFTTEDFDPALLNDPAPLTDWSAGVGAAWAPLDAAAAAERRAAHRDADAAEAGAAWSERAAAYRAEVRYLQAVAAGARVRAAVAAEEAAGANLDVVRRRRAEGLLTDADVLRAVAAVEAARAGRIEAERARRDASGLLALAVGWPDGVLPVPADSTLEADSSGATGGGMLTPRRPDLLASAASAEAFAERARGASRSRLPRVEAFARLETHAQRAFDRPRDDWTVGVRLSLPVFTGLGLEARAAAARRMSEAAAAEHERRLREAAEELQAARRASEAAAEAARAAEAAARAAVEAARLTRRRFEEGLGTTADLLSAQAHAAELEAGAVQARLAVRLARAREAFLTPHDDRTTHDERGTR